MGLSAYRDAISTIAGCIFAAGWWIWIDANVSTANWPKDKSGKPPAILFYYYIPGIISTLGVFMTNIVSLESLNPASWVFDERIGAKVRVWLFLSFIISFSGVAAAIWIMAAVYMPPHNKGNDWPGIALTIQNALIFVSSIFLLGARSSPADEYDAL